MMADSSDMVSMDAFLSQIRYYEERFSMAFHRRWVNRGELLRMLGGI